MAVLRRHTPVFVILILVFAMLILAGCGAPAAEEDEEGTATEPEEAEEPEEEEPDDAPTVAINRWENPMDMMDLIDSFEVLAWTLTPIQGGEEQESLDIAYRYEGSEVVEGGDTSKVNIIFDDEEFVIWLDGSGEVVRAESGGELLPDMAVDLVVRNLLMMLFMPFHVFDTLDIHDVLIGQGPGWEWSVESVGTETIGSMQAEVTNCVLIMGPPASAPGEEVRVNFRVGDFGDFQMLVGYEAGTDGGADQQMQFVMKVTDVAPR